MSEENKNIEGEQPEEFMDNSSSFMEESPGENAPAPEQPETQNAKLQTENMEVHKHPHHVTHKKKWGEYVLEFLMLFLAVFLGFLAEYYLEHRIEKERAGQYLRSFYEDLKADTVKLNRLLAYDENKIAALNTMYNCYDTVTKDLKATACMGLLVKHSKSNRALQLTDRTLRQLANAGGFRLLNREDADSILAYESSTRQYQDFEATVFQHAQDNVRNTFNMLADFKVNAPLQTTTSVQVDTSMVALSGPLLFSGDRALLNKWFNELAVYLRVTTGQRNQLTALKTKSTGLIEFYKNKYHLE